MDKACRPIYITPYSVVVQTLLPGFVAGSTCRPTFFTPSPATYVRHALTTLGVASITCGYWPHSIQVLAPIHTGTGMRHGAKQPLSLVLKLILWPDYQTYVVHIAACCFTVPMHPEAMQCSSMSWIKLKFSHVAHSRLKYLFTNLTLTSHPSPPPPPPPPPPHTHTQSWLTSCLPQWLWVWVVSLLFRRHRLQSITLAKEQGVQAWRCFYSFLVKTTKHSWTSV